jgi:hypothetical protein
VSDLREQLQNTLGWSIHCRAGAGWASLERAEQVRDPLFTYYFPDPLLDPLRSNPRFEGLGRRMRLVP